MMRIGYTGRIGQIKSKINTTQKAALLVGKAVFLLYKYIQAA